jgi:ketosteroid isomerase-like protein
MYRTFVPFCVCLVLALGVIATEAASKDVADEIISITKAQWAAEMKKDSSTAMKNIASDYTEFNFTYPTRLDGKELNQRLAEAQVAASGDLIAAEMANEKVQIYGDTAILTYNFVGAMKEKDGTVQPLLAKSTRVYIRENNNWMLVHANFAAVD